MRLLQCPNLNFFENPTGGKLFVFNRKLCRAFRSDKHNWRKKNDGRTVKETHEKLKVGDRERLNCYYAHAEDSDGLQRRCYWILESLKEDVVLVHYLCSTTSRAGPRGSAAAAAGIAGGQAGARGGGGAALGVAAVAASRPRRAAAQRARYAKYGDYDIDTDEEDIDQANIRRRSSEGDREEEEEEAAAPVHVGHQNPGTNFPSGVEFGSMELLDTNILGRFDSKLDGIPGLPGGGDLPSLAEQFAAARNASRSLDDFLIAPTAGGAGGASGSGKEGTGTAAGRGGEHGIGVSLPFSNSLRKLAHDMMGSGNESLLLQTDLSLGIGDHQDGVPGDLHHLSSPTIDTSGMFGGGVRGGSGGLSMGPGSADFKTKLRAVPGAEGPSEKHPGTTSGEPIVLESFVVGTVGREGGGARNGGGGGVEDISGQLTTGMSLEMGDYRRLHRLGSSFGGNALLGSIDLGGFHGDAIGGSKTSAISNTAVREAAEIVDKDLQQKKSFAVLKSTLHHQKSSAATKGAAEPKVETLRRLMAPGFRNQMGLVAESGSLADMARRTGGSDDDSGAGAGTDLTSSGGRHQRKNPTATPPPRSVHERVAAAAAAATAATAEHREERLHQVRQARHAAVALGTTTNTTTTTNENDNDEEQLIEINPSPLFRLTSHVVHASAEDLQALAGTAVGNATNAAAAEEATTLMKEMSIDQTGMAEAAAAAVATVRGFDAETVADAGMLMRNMSIDERTTPVDEENNGEVVTEETAERISQPVERVHAVTPSEAPKNAFDSDQEVITPSTTATDTSHEQEPAGRDPSLSSLLDINHQQQRVPSGASPGDGSGAAGGEAAATGEGSEDVLLAAFAVHRSRAAAKAAGLKK